MKRTVQILLLALGVLAAQQAMAQSNIGFRRIGASLAYVSPEDIDATFGFGAFADLGQITPEIQLEPGIEYWSQSEGAYGSEVSIRDISVGARAKYFFEVQNSKIRPFAGGGLGLHFLHAEASVTLPGFPTVTSEDSETRLGLDLGGGMETPLSPKVDFHAEAWYGIVSDASRLALRVGLSTKLGM